MTDRADRGGRRSGLSLLELLAAVVLLGILAAVVLPRYGSLSAGGKKDACHTCRAVIETQVQLWYRNQGIWPAANLGDIGADPAYFPEGLPTCPVDGSAYTLDAATHRVVGHGH